MSSGLQSRFFRALYPGPYLVSLLGSASSSICFPVTFCAFPCLHVPCVLFLGWGAFNLTSYVLEENIFGMSCPVDSIQSKERGFQPSPSLHSVPLLVAPDLHPGFCLTLVEKGAELGLVFLQGLGASQGNPMESYPQGLLEVVLPLECFRPSVLTLYNHMPLREFHLSVPAYNTVLVFLFHFLSDF